MLYKIWMRNEILIEKIEESLKIDSPQVLLRKFIVKAREVLKSGPFDVIMVEEMNRLLDKDIKTSIQRVLKKGIPTVVKENVYIPLKVGPRIRGITYMNEKDVNIFLAMFMDQLVSITHMWDAISEAKRKEKFMYLMHNTTSRGLTNHDIDSLLNESLAILREIIDFAQGVIALYRENKGKLNYIATIGLTAKEIEEAESTAMERHPGWVFRNRMPFLIHDTTQDDRVIYYGERRLGSLVYSPIMHEENCFGTVGIGRKEKHVFTEDDLLICRSFAQFLGAILKNHIGRSKLLNEIVHLRKNLRTHIQFKNLVGKSPKMLAVFKLMDTVIPLDVPVLIEGETGTGKELVAHTLHYEGPRANMPFIVQSCSAFTETLLDSELFGHVKGAFTGAFKDKAGLFELADSGTLFLDEIGDAPPSIQAKLLRVVETGIIRRVGGIKEKKVNVRLITATNRDLEKLVKEGKFRKDLYYRINKVKIKLPPLRERKEDIGLLFSYFIKKYFSQHNKDVRSVSIEIDEIVEELCKYDWPGNVRELENLVERLVIFLKGNIINRKSIRTLLPKLQVGEKTLKEWKKDFEFQHLREVLRECNWHIGETANKLGISRQALYKKLKKYDRNLLFENQ
jgi:transcriptional regulator with GAF, ATPase, and Fis domain